MLTPAVSLCLLSVAASALADPEVKLGNGGTLRGVYQDTINGRKVAAFLGVPYAKRPQRFKPAEAAEPWGGVLEAVEEKPDCLQFSELTLKTHGSEDCLYANIFTPQDFSDSSNLDAVIYIHGGGFSFMLGHYGPKYLFEQNVVYVTFKYRVGPLGFLSTGDEVLPGNLGLKDQNMLLKWVQENIRFFGGNPERVLLTGTSAGGASVHYHMLSPLSKDFVANLTTLKYLDQHWNDMLPSLLDYEHTTTIYSKDKVSQSIRDKYLGKSTVDKNIPGLIQICSDRLFVDGVVRAAKLHAEYYKSPVYSYIFSYRGKHSNSEVVSGSNENFGVSHGDDTAYMFQNEIMNAEDAEEDRKMISVMTEFVAKFATTGIPTLKAFRKWPEVCADDDFAYVNIKGPETFEIVSSSSLGQIDFWNSLKLAED